MEFIAAKCTNCGGDLMLPKSQSEAICSYCGTRFFLKDAVRQGPTPTVENWMKLAQRAQESGNPEEAYNFYNRVLEVDSDNIEALIGKGIAVGWQSTLAYPRIGEMITQFASAIQLASPNQLSEINAFISDKLAEVLDGFQKLSESHMKEYIALDNTWSEYLDRSELIFKGIEYSLALNPQNFDALIEGIYLAKNIVQGETYKGYDDQYHTTGISPQYEQSLMERYNQWVLMAQAVDSSFKPPEIRKKACFIATATMNDFNHPYVVTLRRYRDEKMLLSTTGSVIVSIYYRLSPPVAQMISKSSLLRRISLLLIIKPWVMLANKQLDQSSVIE